MLDGLLQMAFGVGHFRQPDDAFDFRLRQTCRSCIRFEVPVVEIEIVGGEVELYHPVGA